MSRLNFNKCIFLCKDCSALARKEECPVDKNHETILIATPRLSDNYKLLNEFDFSKCTIESDIIDKIYSDPQEFMVIKEEGWGLFNVFTVVRNSYISPTLQEERNDGVVIDTKAVGLLYKL